MLMLLTVFVAISIEGTEMVFAEDSTNLIDGSYSVNIESSLGMFTPTSPASLSINGDNADLIITGDESIIKRYDQIYIGKYADITEENQDKIGIIGEVDGETITFKIQLKKEELIDKIYFVVRYKKGYSTSHDGDWYKAKTDHYFTLSEFVKKEEQTAPTEEEKITPQKKEETTTQPKADEIKTGTVFSNNKESYKVLNKSEVALEKNIKKAAKKFTVPATVSYQGRTFKVTAIADKAFTNNKKLTQVTIGKNVTKIGKQAFKGDKKLKKITFKGNLVKSIGKKAFNGINKKATFKAPKKVLKKYRKLIKKAGAPKTAKYKK